MHHESIIALIAKMTLEEKAGLCSGLDFWHTKGVERLGIPSAMLSDGPHGLRKQEEGGDHLGINDSIQAVCFLAGCAIASSCAFLSLSGRTSGSRIVSVARTSARLPAASTAV